MAAGEASEHGSNGASHAALLLPPASPWKWELDGQGRPTWIPAAPGASWATVFEWDVGFGTLLKITMPAFYRPYEAANGDAAAARRAAGLRDLYRCDHDYIARHALPGDDGTDRKASKRRVREGRVVLHEQGVLPWAAFEPEQGLPKRWWKHDAFLVGMREWQLQPVYDIGQSLFGWAARRAAAAAGQVEVQLRQAPSRVRRVVLR